MVFDQVQRRLTLFQLHRQDSHQTSAAAVQGLKPVL